MNRITEKMIKSRVAYLNKITNSPAEYMTTKDGFHTINIGHYHISYAYGGVCLMRTMSDGGGVTCPLSNGHSPKRDLYNELNAFIAGIEAGAAK